MKAKHLLFIIFCLCFLGAHSVNAADEEIINGKADDNSIKMVQVEQSSPTQSIDIKGSSAIDLVNNADNANPTLQPAKPATHGVSIIDKSDRSKKSFGLSNNTPKSAWRKEKIAGVQSIDPKANIKPSKKLQDMETKRKNRKESRKKELESRPARTLLKPNTDGEKNAS